MKLGTLKVNYMKKTKIGILIGLSIMAMNAMADTQTPGNPKNKPVTMDDLSQTRVEIQKAKLQQQLESENTAILKNKLDQAKIKEALDVTGGSAGAGDLPKGMQQATEEALLSEKNSAPQNVGYIYKSDQEKVAAPNNSVIDTLTGSKEKTNTDELAKVLQKFDDLKKEADTTVKGANEYVEIKTFVKAEIAMLSIFDDQKTAKLKFTYMHDDGIQKRRVGSIINVEEGKNFNVEDDTYKVESIDQDGIKLLNNKTKEEIFVNRNR